jgi:hypothetical protein
MKLTEKTEVLREKPVTVPFCPPQIPHGLTRDGTRASAVRGQRQILCIANFSLLTITSYSSVRTTLVYNDTKYSVPFMAL